MKRADRLSADDLIRVAKVVFHRIWVIPTKTVVDAGTNFIADCFQQFGRQLNINQAITSSYHHQSNGQVKACIKFVK